MSHLQQGRDSRDRKDRSGRSGRRDGRDGRRTRDGSRFAGSAAPYSRRQDHSGRRSDTRGPKHVSHTQRVTEEDQARKWVAGEDDFALRQMKHGAMIRINEHRARPIDWLAANLRLIEKDPTVYYEQLDSFQEYDIPVPYEIIESLDLDQTNTLLSDIDKYAAIDLKQPNADFWKMVNVIGKERFEKLTSDGTVDHEARVIEPVSQDVEKVFENSTYESLVKLEQQVNDMLKSKDSMIDVDFWTRILKEATVRKARARLEELHKSVIAERVKKLQQDQTTSALRAKLEISKKLSSGEQTVAEEVPYSLEMDACPEDTKALLKTRSDRVSSGRFFKSLQESRNSVRKMGYVSMKQQTEKPVFAVQKQPVKAPSHMETVEIDPAQSLYEKEAARATEENEENLTTELSLPATQNSLRRIKPRYFNRVMLGYDWNKYNKAHFDSENPPPKLVQGYKFNIFYPDLVNSPKAPSYKIIRDSESKSKELREALAAGEADTCIIKFVAPEPYQDIAFRIVDRQWDSSSHRHAGFKSRFENGVLQLHFRFRKVFYRK